MRFNVEHATVFQQMIEDLEACGWTVNKIAVKLNRQYIQIQRIKEGGRVVYPLDFQLAELHSLECTRNLTIVPRSPTISFQVLYSRA